MFRILFLGQKPIGEMTFRHLEVAQNDHVHIAAVCSNSKDADTWWGSAEIAHRAREAGYPFLPIEEATGPKLADIIRDTHANTLISVQHPRIIPLDVLAQVEHQAFNLHLAKLPDYRGFFGINHALLNQETEYGVTLHWMTEKPDEGNISFEQTVRVSPVETACSLYHKAEIAGLEIFEKLIACLIEKNPIPRKKQQDEGRFYGPRSLETLKEITTFSNSDELTLKARAFYFPPFEPAYIIVEGEKYYVTPATAPAC